MCLHHHSPQGVCGGPFFERKSLVFGFTTTSIADAFYTCGCYAISVRRCDAQLKQKLSASFRGESGTWFAPGMAKP